MHDEMEVPAGSLTPYSIQLTPVLSALRESEDISERLNIMSDISGGFELRLPTLEAGRPTAPPPLLDVSRYKVIITWSPEDGLYVGEMPELAGCKADGETWERTLVNLAESARSWIELARTEDHPVPPQGLSPWEAFVSPIAQDDFAPASNPLQNKNRFRSDVVFEENVLW